MKHIIYLVFMLRLLYGVALIAQSKADSEQPKALITEQIQSSILKENLVGLETERNIHIYLPPSYESSTMEYPVVYYLHNIFSNPVNELENFGIIQQIETAIRDKRIGEFILVAGDFTSATSGTWYENSATSGRWLDYILEELLPFVESKYRIIKERNSRALVGHFVGGRGALKLAIENPELFGVVYAMHPVATGTGYKPSITIDVDWNKIHEAKTFADVEGQGRTTGFVTICQAFLPNPNRPPFYCDFLLERVDGEIQLDPDHNLRYRKNFLLDEILEENAGNLRSLRGLAMDWARFDPTQDHVVSARRFSKLLTEYGVEHEGEEFTGDPWNKYSSKYGRFNTRVIPFLSRYLVFEKP